MTSLQYARVFEQIREKCRREHWYGPDADDPDRRDKCGWLDQFSRFGRIRGACTENVMVFGLVASQSQNPPPSTRHSRVEACQPQSTPITTMLTAPKSSQQAYMSNETYLYAFKADNGTLSQYRWLRGY